MDIKKRTVSLEEILKIDITLRLYNKKIKQKIISCRFTTKDTKEVIVLWNLRYLTDGIKRFIL